MNQFISTIQPIQPIKKMSFTTDESVDSQKSEVAIPFASLLQNAISEYETMSQISDQDGNALSVGNTDNLAQIQIDSMKTQAALQTTVQLTSRVVSAYKEIMQMQV